MNPEMGEKRIGESLARLDERTLQLMSRMEQVLVQLNSNYVTQAEFRPVKSSLEDMTDSVKSDYVTMSEFRPVRNTIYGMISIIIMTVLGSLLALVLRKGI
jgi:hypothetical protein